MPIKYGDGNYLDLRHSYFLICFTNYSENRLNDKNLHTFSYITVYLPI